MLNGNLKTAFSSLRQSRWRTTFTMMGIIIGISSVVTIVSLGEGLKHQIAGQINQLGGNVLTVRPGKLSTKSGVSLYSFLAPSTLTMKDVNSISGNQSIEDTAPIEFVTSSVKADNAELNNVFVAGSSSKLGKILHQKIDYGDFFSDDDTTNKVAVIGSGIAAKLFNLINPVGETLNINGQDFIVHGVLAPNQSSMLSVYQADLNTAIFIPTGAAEDLGSGHTNILQILVKLKPGSNINKAATDIHQAILMNHGGADDFTVLKQNQLQAVSSEVVSTATSFISAIAAISLIVGGIGIMNIMLVSVTERTREIGIRKAVGATNRQILNQFLVEGLVLSLGGGAIGLALSYLINLLLRLYTDWKPVISVPILLLALAVSVLTGVLFSLAPALKAARKDPIAALRGE
jgi:putative ABC transport system permease protein